MRRLRNTVYDNVYLTTKNCLFQQHAMQRVLYTLENEEDFRHRQLAYCDMNMTD
jgi:hypothetical protein